jgi:hypothetical protein
VKNASTPRGAGVGLVVGGFSKVGGKSVVNGAQADNASINNIIVSLVRLGNVFSVFIPINI